MTLKSFFSKFYFLIPALISFVVYYQSIWFGQAWGDDILVIEPYNKDFNLAMKVFFGQKSSIGVHFNPVYSLLCCLINFLFGNKAYPFGFHLYGVLVHTLSCLISAVVFYKITKSKLISVLLVSLWAVHPLNVQIVTRLGCAPAQLSSGLFCLLYLLFFLKAFESEEIKKKILFSVFGFLSFLCAMGTHEQAIFFPFIVLIICIYLHGNKNLFLLTALLSVMPAYLIWRYFACDGAMIEVSIDLIKWTEMGTFKDIFFRAYWLAPQILVHYLRLFFWPDFLSEAKANWFYVGSSVFSFYSVFCQLLISGLIISALAFYKKNPLFSIGIFWFFLTMILVSQIMPLFMMIDEHYCYLAIFGLLLSVFSFLLKYKDIFSIKNVLFITTVIFLLLLWRTLSYIPSGKDFLTRYIYCASEALLWNRQTYIAQAINLAGTEHRENELPTKWLNEKLFLESVQKWIDKYSDLNPDLSVKYGPYQVVYNFYVCKGVFDFLLLTNQYEKLNNVLKIVLAVRKDWLGYHEVSKLFSKIQHWEESWKCLKKAIELNPRIPAVYDLDFIKIAINAKKLDEAGGLIENYIALNSKNTNSYVFAGLFYYNTNSLNKALHFFKKALFSENKISKGSEDYLFIAKVFLKNNMQEEARKALNIVLTSVDPFNEEAKKMLLETVSK